MNKIRIDAYGLLEKVRQEKPVIHHLTNWVTIYDCANVVKVLGASPVMAHAKEEVAEMASIASSLVLNIGTLTVDFIEAMKSAAKSANKKGIPVVLDACGCGATELRNRKTAELLEEVRIDIIKGNASEIAKIAGEDVKTKGVDAAKVEKNLIEVARHVAKKYRCTAVITGAEDIITDDKQVFILKNGHPIMASIVGTGCMAASVIGTFATVEKNLALAATSGLVCFEIASECAAKRASGPGTFKEKMYDCLFHLDKATIGTMQKVEACE
ncbi:MAG: hydroxyethylthiazole kinase [Candidatus Omnitrophica bacterium]|nr:hydroxyethylthiazole kinase [Candidatus Omnitrophota bacterium]